jgi:organic radical activating enzyme
MKPIAIVNFNHDNYLYITYSITSTCNYNCNYCWPNAHDGKYRFPVNLELVCNNLEHLISTYKTKFNKTNVRLTINGGEPTLWPELGEFVKRMHESTGCRITLNTNGSRTVRWWEEYANYFDDIQISVHREQCDVNHIKQLLDLIYTNTDTFCGAQVLMDPLAWDTSMSILNQLVDHPTPWLVKTVLITDPTTGAVMPNYQNEHLNFMRDAVKKRPPEDYIEHMKSSGKIDETDKKEAKIIFSNGTEEPYNTFRLMENGWNKFYGWDCNVGIDRLGISYSGEVEGNCGEKVFDTSLNIYDPDFIEKFKPTMILPIKCKKIYCDCTSDIRVTKRKNNV